MPAEILVPVFPQRSPPSLLTTAACGGLRSAPDCRTRRALLHLSYSYASPCGPALLVTQDPFRKCGDPSFDHLVGAQQERRRDRQADGARSLQGHDQLELGRLLNREIGGGGAPPRTDPPAGGKPPRKKYCSDGQSKPTPHATLLALTR